MTRILTDVLFQVVSFQTDRMLTVLAVVTVIIAVVAVNVMTASKQRQWLLSLLVASLLLGGLTAALYALRIPRGLSGHYFSNARWQDDENEQFVRYFALNTPGRRVDRFIDFNPNDFNNLYSDQPFSIQWQGALLLPHDDYQVQTTSNFGTWLYLDDQVIEGSHELDFGTPEGRMYLREGWSYDEVWNHDPSQTFVWSVGRSSEFYLGVDELTDYVLEFRCIPFANPERPTPSLTITVNGVELETVALQDDWASYAVAVPGSALEGKAPGFFRVILSYPHASNPSETAARRQDARDLAAAFDFARLRKRQSAAAGVPRQNVPQFRKGMHSITLKALQNTYNNPYIQLRWAQTGRLVAEDFVFPGTQPIEQIQRKLAGERLLLATCIVLKAIFILTLIVLLGRRIGPDILRNIVNHKKEYGILCLLVVGACVIRLLFLYERWSSDPSFSILPQGTDQLNYVFFARGFLRGYWPGLSHEPFYFGPLISFYFIVCSMLFGESLLIVRLITTILASVSIWFLYAIATKTFSRPVAYLAAGLCAVNGVLMFYDTTILIAPLITVLNIIALWLFHCLKEKPSYLKAVGAGVTLGLSVLARSNMLLFLPVLLVWIMAFFQGKIWRRIGWFALVCLAMGLTILPVTIRNYYAWYKHEFVLTTSGGGINLWIGNHPAATGTYYGFGSVLQETRERMKAQGTTYRDEVLHFIVTSPKQYAALLYRKFRMFWRGYEIGNLLPYYLFRVNSKVLRLPWLNFVLIGPLGITGMVLAARRWKQGFLLYAYVGVQMFTNVAFFTLARYRVPVVPVLSVFAAFTLYDWGVCFRKKRWWRFMVGVGLFVGLYVLLNYPYAADLYHSQHGEAMPFWRVLRYWDLFQE